ncbi:MAG: YgjV family protein [Alphaproteobacteria bacterium]
MSNIVVAQILGFFALFFGVSGFLNRDEKKLKILLIVQSVFLVPHFILLNANTGAVMSIVTIIRNYLSLNSKFNKLWILFVILYLVSGIYKYQRPIDILPIFASVLGTYAFFKLDNLKLRTSLLFCTLSWLFHNIYVGSLGPSIMEAMIFSSNLRTIIKIRKS